MNDVSLDRVRVVMSQVLSDVPEVAAAYAYGSRFAGRPMPGSDLDIALVLAAGVRGDDPLLAERVAGRVASELQASVEIDAHIADDLPLPVQGRVVTQGVLVFERDPVRRVDFETSTRRLYFDFLPFLERDAKIGLAARG